jgi:hypothetical protein
MDSKILPPGHSFFKKENAAFYSYYYYTFIHRFFHKYLYRYRSLHVELTLVKRQQEISGLNDQFLALLLACFID